MAIVSNNRKLLLTMKDEVGLATVQEQAILAEARMEWTLVGGGAGIDGGAPGGFLVCPPALTVEQWRAKYEVSMTTPTGEPIGPMPDPAFSIDPDGRVLSRAAELPTGRTPIDPRQQTPRPNNERFTLTRG